MFALDEADLGSRILGCADGPASFNRGLSQMGGRVTSVDPMYALGREAIRERIDRVFPTILEQARQNAGQFVWTTIRSIEELGQTRMRAMAAFLADYERGKREGRYVVGALPSLPFKGQAFDLALCSHFLFLYSEKLSVQFHVASIRELLRVAREVRVFPLLDMAARKSPHVDAVVTDARSAGYHAEVLRVDYEFQRGGNEMLRLSRHG
jgi:hypothetical protein